ncbi:MAG: restriction endonuclease subunit S, partial [Flavobacterium sp.]
MSKIGELIAQFCPEGIEFKELGAVMSITRGASPRPISTFITGDSNGVPWIKIGDVQPRNKYITKTEEKITIEGSKKSRLLKKGSLILSNSMSFGRPYILKIDGCIHDGWISMQNFENCLTSDFLYYLLRSDNIQKYWKQNASSSTVQNLNADIVRRTVIPIPPLEIQNEIVSILDKFTLLEAELEAELEARKKQYEHYRDALLSFETKNVDWKTLGEIAKIQRGTAITKKETVLGEYPVIANGPGPIYFHNEFNRKGEIVVVARSGAYCGLVSYWNEPLFLTDAFSIHPEPNLLKTKFVYYFLKNQQEKIHQMKKGSGVPHVRATDFESYLIPILPKSEQERIVNILD